MRDEEENIKAPSLRVIEGTREKNFLSKGRMGLLYRMSEWGGVNGAKQMAKEGIPTR